MVSFTPKVKVRLDHEITVTPIKLPLRIKEFLLDVNAVSYVELDGETYEFMVSRALTRVYKGDESYLANIVKMLMQGKDVSNADMPKPMDYFPNNYWFGCHVDLCTFESMDLILNLDLSEKELNLKAIVGELYYHLRFTENSTTVGQLRLLSVERGGDLKNLLTSLIRPETKEKTNKRKYEEFVNLKYVQTGHHFALNATSEMFFLIKDHRIYSLLTIRQGGSVKQILDTGKFDGLSLFGDTAGSNHVQAAFTRPNERLVLIMDDFLLQYSVSSFPETGTLTELQESFEIPSTFEHISAAITLRNYTYIFTRRHYQVFPAHNFNAKEYQATSGNFFACPLKQTLFEPTLVSYSDSVRRPTTQKHLITVSQPPNKVTTNMLIQIVLLISVGAFVVFVTAVLYVKKFQKTTFMPNVSLKEKERKSERSGSNSYLSTAFNLAKSSSEKGSKGVKVASKLKAEEPGDLPKSKMPKKLSLKDSTLQLRGSKLKVNVDQAGSPKEGSPRNLAETEGSTKSLIEREGSSRDLVVGSRRSPIKLQGAGRSRSITSKLSTKSVVSRTQPSVSARLPSVKLPSKAGFKPK